MKELKTIWPQWEVEELIGKGSYGNVYKIKREEMGTVSYAALKIIEIPQEQSEVRELMNSGMDHQSVKFYYHDLVKSIQNEIAVMETLKTGNNIVSIEDYSIREKKDSIGWKVYIRMELLTNLNTYLSECGGDLDPAEVVKIGMDICTALECCEKSQIIHRDIKPDNIFRNPYGDYKLGDFGIARQMEMTKSMCSQKGTSLYMAPEVYKGQHYDKTVDMYSLGIMLYKLLNHGRFPFMPPVPELIHAGDAEEAMRKRIEGEPLSSPAMASERLAAIIKKACAYDPKQRYQSASELKHDLEKVKQEEYRKEDYRTETAPVVSGLNHLSNNESKDAEKEGTDEPPVELSAGLAHPSRKEEDLEGEKTWGIWGDKSEPEKREEPVKATEPEKQEDIPQKQPATEEQPYREKEKKKVIERKIKEKNVQETEKKGLNKKLLIAIPAALVILLIVVFVMGGKGDNQTISSSKSTTTKPKQEDNSSESDDLNYLLTGDMYTKNSNMGGKVVEEDVKNVKYEDKKWAVEKDSSGKSYNLNLSKVPIAFSGVVYRDYIMSDINLKKIEQTYGTTNLENFKTIYEPMLGKSLAVVRYADQDQKQYSFYALYEFDGKKLKLQLLDSEKLNNNELVQIGTEEYDCKREGNEIKISKGGSKVTLLPAEMTSSSGEIHFSGYVANDKDAYEDIAEIYYSEDKDNGDYAAIRFTDGSYAIDPVITVKDNTMTVKWAERYTEYNGSTKQVEDEKEYTFDYMMFSKNSFGMNETLGVHNGGVVIKKDGKTYKYLSSEDEYEAQKLSGTVEETDISGLSDEEKSALVGTQTNIMSEVEKGLADAGINAEVDQTTGQVNLDSSILFALDDATLSEEGKSYLDGFLDVYTSVLMSDTYKNSIAKIKVEGYTDSSGSADHNQTLSEQRAASVADYCISKVPDIASIIETKGCGSSNLVYDENGNENADASRRVAFKFALNVNQ